MQNKNEFYFENTESDIDLQKLAMAIIDGKWIIGFTTAILTTIALVYSLSLPNIYQSKALLVPNKSMTEYNSLQNYSSIASVAGLNISPKSSESNSMKAIQKLSSLSFFEYNILPNIFLPNLMAVDSWNPQNNVLTFNKNIYNADNDTWIRDYSFPNKLIPSAQESYKIFTENHLSITEDKKSGLITIKIKHQSPYIAMEWVALIVDKINTFYREKDRDEAELAVKYLNEQISKTKFSEIKQSIAVLLQQETQKLTLIEANKFYVYEYIDPPAVMEYKSEPRRSLICILGLIFGLCIGVVIALLSYYFSKEHNS